MHFKRLQLASQRQTIRDDRLSDLVWILLFGFVMGTLLFIRDLMLWSFSMYGFTMTTERRSRIFGLAFSILKTQDPKNAKRTETPNSKSPKPKGHLRE